MIRRAPKGICCVEGGDQNRRKRWVSERFLRAVVVDLTALHRLALKNVPSGIQCFEVVRMGLALGRYGLVL